MGPLVNTDNVSHLYWLLQLQNTVIQSNLNPSETKALKTLGYRDTVKTLGYRDTVSSCLFRLIFLRVPPVN